MFNPAESDQTIRGTWSITEMQLEQQRIQADKDARIAEANARVEEAKIRASADIKRARSMGGDTRAVVIAVISVVLGLLAMVGVWGFNNWQNSLIEERTAQSCVQSGGQWVLKFGDRTSYRDCVKT